MKNIPTFEEVQKMNFPQPDPEIGQIWFHPTDKAPVVITDISMSVDGLPSYICFTNFYDIGASDMKIGAFLEKFIYCPTVVDILTEMPDFHLTCYILSGKKNFELSRPAPVLLAGKNGGLSVSFCKRTAIAVCVEAYLLFRSDS